MAYKDHNVLNNQTTKLSLQDSQELRAERVVSKPYDTHLVAPTADDSKAIFRRSANYQQSILDHDFVQSLRSDYTGEIYTKRAEELKEDVRRMFHEVTNNGSSLSLLKLIDTFQRLGVSYHFVDEIKCGLDITVSNKDKNIFVADEDLFSRALRFRLLRQHGYEVSQDKLIDIFKSFKEEIGSSDDCRPSIVKDVEGMLSLYEASFYAFEGEEILDEAQILTSRLLKEYLLVNEGINNTSGTSAPNLSNVKQLISHALELPLHWRMPRLEARWFIDAYENMQDQIDYRPLLLEFAKLDFNIVQATYQEELKYASRWYKDLGLTANVHSYTRERLVENFFSSVGYNFDPKLGDFRKVMTKVNCLITPVDDTYDVYGSLEELKLFTDAIERWDSSTIEGIPDYMRVLFLAVYNTTNEIAYEILKKHGRNVLPHLKKAWVDICNEYLVEAKWYYNGYTPTFEEFVNHGWMSITGCFLPQFFYCLLENEIKEEPLECIKNCSSDLIRWSFTILRFLNDLGNSTDELKRGDNPPSIQCYMNQEGVSEVIAREHIKHLVKELWKKINKELYSAHSVFPRSFVDSLLGTIRCVHIFYQCGDKYKDGYGAPDEVMKNWIMSVLIEPVPIEDKRETKAQ